MFILIVISIAGCSTKPTRQTDLDEFNLVGRVKSVKTYRYPAKKRFGKIQLGKSKGFHQHTFNLNGDLESWMEFHENGDIDTLLIFTHLYDEDGNKTEFCRYDNFLDYDDPSNEIKHKFHYENGLITTEEVFYNQSQIGKTLYKYDENDNVVSAHDVGESGEITLKVTFQYDERDNLLEKIIYEADGQSVLSKYVYKYDQEGNKIAYDEFESDGSFEAHQSFTYDNEGNLFEEKYHNTDGSVSQVITYDAHGNRIQNDSDVLSYREKYEYLYDDIGNWIETLSYKESTLEYIEKREIEYFE